MAKNITCTNPCSASQLPRIGGAALIGGVLDWPETPEGKPLTLVASLPSQFLNENAACKVPGDHFISVFSYYPQGEYFIDSITYYGAKEELDWLRDGYTRVILHREGSEVYGPVTIPPTTVEIDSEDLDGTVPYQGSKIGGSPDLLQAELLALDGEKFAMQLYGGKFPEPHRGIFGLSDAMGYLFIAHKPAQPGLAADAGTFFVQVT
jgi:hypothetical protein